MTSQQKAQAQMLAIIANLAISGMTLSYVRDSEHRFTKLEVQMQHVICQQDKSECKQSAP